MDQAQRQRDAELDGVSLLVSSGKAATLSEAESAAAWKGQDKVAHCCRLVPQLFLVPPLFLQTPQRLAALVFLSRVGALLAGLIERQGRRALAARQQPLTGLMPAGRETLHPTVARLFKACTDDSLVQVKDARGRVVEARCARLHPVQAQLLKMIGLPQPAELFTQPVLACTGVGEAYAWQRERTVHVSARHGAANGRAGSSGAGTTMAGFHRGFDNVADRSLAQVVQDSCL